jgi:hypothetical protein
VLVLALVVVAVKENNAMKLNIMELSHPFWSQDHTLAIVSFKNDILMFSQYMVEKDAAVQEETPTAQFALENLIENGPTLEISHNDKLYKLVCPPLAVPPDYASGPFGEDEYCDYSVLDLYFRRSHWHSRFVDTKINKAKYSSRLRNINQSFIIGTLCVPFKNEWEHKNLIMYVNRNNLITDIEIASVTVDPAPAPVDNFTATWHQYMWGVNIVEKSRDADNSIEFSAQLIWNNDGSNCEHATKMWVETDAGFVPKKNVFFDDKGQATFKIMPLGLTSGDQIKVKLNSSVYSGINSISVTV